MNLKQFNGSQTELRNKISYYTDKTAPTPAKELWIFGSVHLSPLITA